MKRRSFTTRRRGFMLGSTAGLFVSADARAQKRRRIGALTALPPPPDGVAPHPAWIALLDGLRTYGWTEDKNLEIIRRATGGDPRKTPRLADELLSAGVELVLAFDTPSTQALLQRTRTVPILFTGLSDPVAAGLVSSLTRPGGNTTGLANDLDVLAAKYVEFSRELIPGLRRLAVMLNTGNQAAVLGLGRLKAAASTFGIEVVPMPVATPEQLEPALATLARDRPPILMITPSAPLNLNNARIAEFAIRHGIVPLGSFTFQVREGCLLAYGPDLAESNRRLAYYVDRILRGAAPRDLPVELMHTRLTINLATARALGITIPASMLVRADEVIR